MDLEEEQKLVEAAKIDSTAFGVLYDYYYPKILNYILRRVDDSEAGLDITSITFFKAMKALPRFKWRAVPFSAWLYRIAGNEIASYYRQKRLKPLSLDFLFEQSGFELVSDLNIEAELIDWQDTLLRHQEFQIIKQLIANLPLKYQEVLALRFFEKKSLEDISKITGKKLNTIKSLLKRGVEKLRLSYKKHSSETPNPNATFELAVRSKLWRKQL